MDRYLIAAIVPMIAIPMSSRIGMTQRCILNSLVKAGTSTVRVPTFWLRLRKVFRTSDKAEWSLVGPGIFHSIAYLAENHFAGLIDMAFAIPLCRLPRVGSSPR